MQRFMNMCAGMLAALVMACSAHAAETLRGPVHVIDADTIDVGGTRVRLHAIDAPELDQTCRTARQARFACGQWASDQVTARFEGRTARRTARDRDRYGRIVATCAVDGADMGAVIVGAGWAFAYRRYGMDYDRAEKAALRDGRGLHDMRTQSPSDHRRARAVGDGPPDPACAIKGNISSGGRIFHVPGQDHYDRTSIRTDRGERWFCSRAEARAAGWRAARR